MKFFLSTVLFLLMLSNSLYANDSGSVVGEVVDEVVNATVYVVKTFWTKSGIN
jgi:hypothetical protein